MKKENKPEKYEKTIVIPIELKTWKALRLTAFEKEISMNKWVRATIKKELKKAGREVD